MAKLKEEAGYYILFRDREGKVWGWVDQEAGTGRVLTYFLQNMRKRVSLEEIARISNWNDPQKRLTELVNKVNSLAPYQIDKVKRKNEVYYKMS